MEHGHAHVEKIKPQILVIEMLNYLKIKTL
jgi:hypothetical protein